MHLIGTIKTVQIQKSPLKSGEGTNRVYSAAPIAHIHALRLTSRGVIGLDIDDHTIMDVHHIDHPQSRNRGNANGISVGFASSYKRMQVRFQNDLSEGYAGENIIIQQADDFSIDLLHTDLIIECQFTGTCIRLHDLMIAAPCEPFSQFVNQREVRGAELKETLQFLSDGTRGFYATLDLNQVEPVIRPGDKIYAVLED
jgi:hypothetical protein